MVCIVRRRGGALAHAFLSRQVHDGCGLMLRSYFEWQRWRWLALGGALALLAYMIYRYGGRWFSELSGDFLQYWASVRINLVAKIPLNTIECMRLEGDLSRRAAVFLWE